MAFEATAPAGRCRAAGHPSLGDAAPPAPRLACPRYYTISLPIPPPARPPAIPRPAPRRRRPLTLPPRPGLAAGAAGARRAGPVRPQAAGAARAPHASGAAPGPANRFGIRKWVFRRAGRSRAGASAWASVVDCGRLWAAWEGCLHMVAARTVTPSAGTGIVARPPPLPPRQRPRHPRMTLHPRTLEAFRHHATPRYNLRYAAAAHPRAFVATYRILIARRGARRHPCQASWTPTPAALAAPAQRPPARRGARARRSDPPRQQLAARPHSAPRAQARARTGLVHVA